MSDLIRERSRNRPRTALLALIGVALLGSAWAAYAKSVGCGSCGGEDPGGTALAVLGILWYAGILSAALLSGSTARGPFAPIVSWAVLLAGGLHGVLLVFLLGRGIACVPCLVTGVAAIGAAGIILRLQPEILFRATVLFPTGGFVATLWLVSVGAVGIDPATTVPLPPRIEVSDREIFGGSEGIERPQVNMVILYRSDCPYCLELDEEVLPQIRKDFGDSLRVRYISADAMPGISTPTIILSGPEGSGRLTIPGLPHPDILRREISNILEAARHASTKL